MRIVFAATGEIALPLLSALAEEKLIALVLTAPDAPGKRGKTLVQSPVKKLALELGLEVYQPETIRKEAREHIASYGADTLLSFCYGKIFGPKFLSIFSNTFNVHPSILPKYRGPSPVYQAIRNGDRKTGVSLQKIGARVQTMFFGKAHANCCKLAARAERENGPKYILQKYISVNKKSL